MYIKLSDTVDQRRLPIINERLTDGAFRFLSYLHALPNGALVSDDDIKADFAISDKTLVNWKKCLKDAGQMIVEPLLPTMKVMYLAGNKPVGQIREMWEANGYGR